MQDNTNDRPLNVHEVAALIGFEEQTIYKWVRLGRIPVIRYNHRLRFNRADIERWQQKQTTGMTSIK